MTKSILYSFAVIAMLAFTGPTAAGEVGLHVVFSDGEASIIRGYYSDQSAPQMGKKKNNKGLPPGIAKNLQRGKLLPPGIAKQVLPSGLNNILPSPPRGFERVIVSGKVLLVEIATQVIHDVLEDVILG